MRLLETTDGRSYNLTSDFVQKGWVPPYAILSHTWEDLQEITFDDVIADKRSKSKRWRASARLLSRKTGYDKLRFCAKQAHRDGLQYFWIDTCCIDKSDSQELEIAINSMFCWYKNASKCYVYLSDVTVRNRSGIAQGPTWLPAFRKSRWFTRGWTLQELLAPAVVEFFSKEGKFLGNRFELKEIIHDITNIPTAALSGAPLGDFGVDERLSWASTRQTTREEDEVYSLLGLFGVKLPFIYTEGYDQALRRLLNEIDGLRAASVNPDMTEVVAERTTLPFQRDGDFVYCAGLAALHRMSGKSVRCAALVGFGGVGKSQIVIEYAYQILHESPDTWVFWVHAETKERLRESYLQIAKKANIAGCEIPEANVVYLVNRWLSDEANGKWLLVLDSANDACVFLDDTSSLCATWKSGSSNNPAPPSILPESAIGSVIVTSRSHEVACILTGNTSSTIEVYAMNDRDAFTLLQKKFTSPVKQDEAVVLASALGHMPLALTQAAAYINRTPRMNITRYLEEITYDQKRLLDSEQVDIRRDATASNSIIKTWQVSFDYLKKRSPSATELLLLMSLFDRQGISKSLLEGRYTVHEHSLSDFDHDLYMLTSLCFVKLKGNSGDLEMHELVQLTTKRWMELNGEIEKWKKLYIGIINEHFPEGRPEHWVICERLFPHVQAALNSHPHDADALEAWASISWKAAWYLGERGEFDAAYKHSLNSLDVREVLLDADDPEVFDSLNSVGVALSRLGRYEEAKVMYQKAVKAQERVLGVDHLDTLTSMLNIAQLSGSQGQWEDAEALLQHILDIVSKKETKAGNSLMLSTLTTLSNAHRSLGRYDKAAGLEVRILQSRELDLGSEHPTTVAVKGNLAYTYRHLNRLQEAEKLNLEILMTQEMQHHAEVEILATKAHLASIYLLQGRTSLAEILHREVFAAMQARYGPNHPDTLHAMANLGHTYEKQGRLDDALALQLQLVDLRTGLLGNRHPATIAAKACAAKMYDTLAKSEGSEA